MYFYEAPTLEVKEKWVDGCISNGIKLQFKTVFGSSKYCLVELETSQDFTISQGVQVNLSSLCVLIMPAHDSKCKVMGLLFV